MVEPAIIYRSIIRLTETRDINSVNEVFLEIVETLIEGDFALYVLQGVGRDNHFVLSSGGDPFGAEAEQILALFQPNSDVKAQLALDIRPFPLASSTGLHAVLLVDRRAKVIDEVFLNFLISVYCNQYNLVETSSRDALTGLLNRGEFDKKLFQLIDIKGSSQRSCDQNEKVICLALLDIDHFKGINDKFGHLYGDEVLLLLGQILQAEFRDEDLLFRYGGEEFAIILRNVFEEQIYNILERARRKIESFDFPQVGQVTVSMGYTLLEKVESASGLISKADDALYYAKEHGRNQVQSYQELLAQGKLEPKEEMTGEIHLF